MDSWEKRHCELDAGEFRCYKVPHDASSSPLDRVLLSTISSVLKYDKKDEPRRFTVHLHNGGRLKLRAISAADAAQWMAVLEAARLRAAV